MPRGIPKAPLTNKVPPTIKRDAVNETTPIDARNKVFHAKFMGNCARCGEPFDAGDTVFYSDNEIVADHGCDEMSIVDDGDDEMFYGKSRNGKPTIAVMPRGKTKADMCRKCFIIHATGQMECEV